MKNVRRLIADDDAHFFQYLGDVLSDDFCIEGTVSDETALIAATVALDPHIVITGIKMPTMTRLDAIRQLEALKPELKIIVLTSHEEPECVATAFAAGTSAFLRQTGGVDLSIRTKELIRNLLLTPYLPTCHSAPRSSNATAVIEDRSRGIAVLLA